MAKLALNAQIEVVRAADIQPSTYNPRTADKTRLHWISLSLRKLGFLLPIYADENGEILSGHQRHHVATAVLGATELPVFRLPAMPLEKRQALNVLFNRSTNDMSQNETTQSVTQRVQRADIERLASTLPDIPAGSALFFRCMHQKVRSVRDLIGANTDWKSYTRNVARSLYLSTHHRMPVIVQGNTIINGSGRVQYASECGLEDVNVVEVTEDEAAFSRLVLNGISMDFDIHNRYEDVLRYNSFRRSSSARFYLGRGFISAMNPRLRSKDCDVFDSNMRKRWTTYYGNRVVDFGSGRGEETRILREVGVEVASFEPYKTSEKDELQREKSRDFCKKFLADISDGRQYTSVFCSSVMNSVPYRRDREHMVVILAALCGPRTRCHIHTKPTTHGRYGSVAGKLCQNPTEANSLQFVLDYEPGILLGGMRGLPKVQKFFEQRELYDLAKVGFDVASVSSSGGSDVHCIAAKPNYTLERLREALEFEFNLPYPDGERLDLVDEAIAAFSARLGKQI